MHTPGLITRLEDAITLLKAYQLSEAEHEVLVRLAATKVAEVNRSLENHLSTLTNPTGEVPCRKR